MKKENQLLVGLVLLDDQAEDIRKNARSSKVLSYRKQSQKCRMSKVFSLMSTETKINDYLRKRMLSSIAVHNVPVLIYTIFPHQLFVSAS